MKAIGFYQSLSIDNPDALVDVDIKQPIAIGRDLLVKIQAIAVNPADYKVRLTTEPKEQAPKILGWDAVGEVIATGELVTQFQPGDLVYYAGDITRQGSNAEYQLVDERIVGIKPKSLSAGEAAALPLTAITAWELLFEHLGIKRQPIDTVGKSDEIILVVGAAGGVGSMLIQLVKKLTGATIIATASRERSQAWVKKLGADFVIDHTQSLIEQINALGLGAVTHVASLNSTDTYFKIYTELLAPFGKIAIIDDPKALDVTQLKLKSLSLHWEFMFARSMFHAVDLQAQGKLLSHVADLVDHGHIQTTLGQHLGKINAENLRSAHAALEAGSAIGKIVLEGF
ncbi:zinc-binding alcohol dehydrogenase family protein [uncultured Shewanella sp.]|uniref:zinc-binding alcohol dehydrogenase family protein n=1 Tax=uncultured Shewanella sp. TaxID=173975 RepID=UPI002614A9F0|nr:zinc-binding alcohol dehydrogenase family protein [uncultured Shewanella sp.]